MESKVRGNIYIVDAYEIFPDGTKSNSLISAWHGNLAGAKRFFDKEYDLDKSLKLKWKKTE